MSTIRRIVIGFVFILLALDATALAIVKFASGPTPSAEKSKLVVWVDKQEEAQGLAAIFKHQGYEPLVKEAVREESVESDYRLAMKSTKKSLLEPVAQVLKANGHKQLSYSQDGTTLYYGPVYKQKAQALRVAERLKTKDRTNFEVVRGTKVMKIPSYRVILLEISDNLIPEVTDGLYEEYDIKNIEEIPLDREEEGALGEEAPAEEAEEPVEELEEE